MARLGENIVCLGWLERPRVYWPSLGRVRMGRARRSQFRDISWRNIREIYCMYQSSFILFSGFVQNLKVLENPWIWKMKLKALSVLEFIKKYLKVVTFFLVFLIFWNCLTLKNGHSVEPPTSLESWNSLCFSFRCFLKLFGLRKRTGVVELVLFISHKAVWNSLKLPYEQFNYASFCDF